MSMEELLTTAVAQVPGLVVMVVIVGIFIKYLEKRDTMEERSTVAIDKNSTVIGEVRECLRENNTVLRQVNSTLVRINGK